MAVWESTVRPTLRIVPLSMGAWQLVGVLANASRSLVRALTYSLSEHEANACWTMSAGRGLEGRDDKSLPADWLCGATRGPTKPADREPTAQSGWSEGEPRSCPYVGSCRTSIAPRRLEALAGCLGGKEQTVPGVAGR